ncbi:MAG: RNA methyltransferase [Hamadaea sp.]|uniref:TrmH family RNA methyltransferase n=1 Tax=Hamadaea sp. TaxID=2024425 RepID=UPI001816FA03|nr:TrmH family RNA methyltransferase [Hamadaea sp.]NUR71444.1 RNA methyltransferase [Hamadaea sp.]NUT23754.1 RNA methyltransferase [Hamadaea sp.]
MAAVPVSARDPRISALLSTRTPSGSVLAEGLWAHQCLLRADADIEVLVTCPDLLDPAARRLARDLTARARTAVEVSAKTYARIGRRTKASGLASLVRLRQWRAEDLPVDPGTRVLVADGIEYATNLGALIRVVDASGASALLITNRQARLEHPDVFTASRGTLLTTPVVDFGEPAAAAQWLLRSGFTIRLALPGAPGGFRTPADPTGPTAIVVGSEGRGVAAEWRSVPHEPVSIPMRGRADSLNVAVAAGVLLFG